LATRHNKIYVAKMCPSLDGFAPLSLEIDRLEALAAGGDNAAVLDALQRLVPNYNPNGFAATPSGVR